MALVSYPGLVVGDIPATTVFDKEAQWADYAVSPLANGLNRAINAVSDAVATTVEVGVGVSKAVLKFGAGAFSQTAQVVSDWAHRPVGEMDLKIRTSS